MYVCMYVCTSQGKNILSVYGESVDRGSNQADKYLFS